MFAGELFLQDQYSIRPERNNVCPSPSTSINRKRLIGFYHWNRSVRTMHQHENCIELNFMLSGNGTHIVGNEICHTQPGDIIVYDSKIMHDESLMLDSLTDACCIAVTGLQRPDARPNAVHRRRTSHPLPHH